MDKISVIVPVYNVEKYVKKCLESISNQTYKNIEIIIVNDGATDNSEKICREFVGNEDRAKLYTKENGGLSSARNHGMQFVTGNYVLFIDSDDYISEEMIEELYNNIKAESADVSVCGVYNVYSDGQSPQCKEEIYFSCDRDGFLKEYFIGEKIPGTICNKLISYEIASKISFPVGKIYEDAFYQFKLVKYAKKYVVTTKPYYYYFHRENSITTKPYTIKNMDCIEIYSNFYDYIKREIPFLSEFAFFRLSYAHFMVFDKMLLSENYKEIKEYREVLGFLKKNFWKIYKNKNFRKGRRIAVLMLKINIKLYRFLLFKDLKRKGVNA
ncbi:MULTISPECIES: glycosyltransferase family 2 protein [unclassified Parvimonas]|uniref:glycosyltransferase family 2 protein n=1 Tax=unclassified Parvimonas TaxID=1151464 RepID=UPI002B46CD3F|nr:MULTISPECIES: glycosyltransferase family 2 protein [unclassified Parvimonas]MEB3024618.1 glycosyltransferase family 2 protein [Parvimonas sp. M13]MEB3072672.1 glycosyltransferase family 2 protein [Parvimonas sp. C2]MEB3088552.1 glycosyltransferase family 2 protein [Parvimonas sp. M20]